MILQVLLFVLAVLAQDGDACNFLLYGAKEVSNGANYKGELFWKGCTNGNTSAVKVALLAQDESELISQTLDNLESGKYYDYNLAVPQSACGGAAGSILKIQVSGVAAANKTGSVFKPVSKEVKCMTNAQLILVQTNKPLYKPGDTVEAQIFCLDREDTNSCENVDITVSTLTPTSVVMNVEKYSFGTGDGQSLVAEYKFAVDQKPVLGKYCLKIESKATQTVEECFDIEEYVLPTFQSEVVLDQTAYAKDKGGDVTGKLKATYTYGEPVQNAYFVLECWVANKYLVHKKTYPDTEAGYNFVIEEEKMKEVLDKVSEDYEVSYQENEIRCVTNATENKESFLPPQTSESSIKIVDKDLVVECCDTFSCPKVSRPGKYSICLTVRYETGIHDGEPLMDGLTLKASLEQCDGEDIKKYLSGKEVYIGRRTELEFEIKEKSEKEPSRLEYPSLICSPWQKDSVVASVKATDTKDSVSTEFRHEISQYTSNLKTYFSIGVCNAESSFEAANEACLTVMLSPPEKRLQETSFMFLIKSRGVVRSVKVHEGVSDWPFNINFNVTPEMTPNFIVFVSTVASNDTYDEVLPASITIPVEQNKKVFSNSVSLSFEKKPEGGVDYFEPGQSASVKVEAGTADSIVALIGMDKRVVAAAGKANIIQLDDVVEALASDDKDEFNNDGFIPFCWFPLPSSSSNAKATIKEAGLIYLSNGDISVPGETYGDIYYTMPLPMEREEAMMFSHESDAITKMGGNQETSSPSPRSNFLENIAFHLMKFSNESDVVDIPLGDMITTHILHASAISPTSGFATVIEPLEIKVFKNVFSTVHTPYSVKRKESFLTMTTVCNYQEEFIPQIQLQFTFDSKNFQDMSTVDEPCSGLIPEGLKSQECKSIKCPLLALSVGDLEVSVTVSNGSNADQVFDIFVKKVKVKPEGCEQIKILDRKEVKSSSNEAESQACFNLQLPDNAVNDSGIAHIRWFSALSAPALQNPGKLVQQPTGCGEQTMIYLAPLIYLKRILEASQMALSREKDQELTTFMLSGYQRELGYKHIKAPYTGGYSAWGDSGATSFHPTTESDPASTWLTAFVARTFAEAKNGEYVDIDTKVLDEAYTFMLSPIVLNSEGEVTETGRVLHSEMQGGSSAKETLAAYHLLSLSQMPSENLDNLSEDQKSSIGALSDRVRSRVSKAVESESSDSYLLALSGVALFDALKTNGVEDPASDGLLVQIRDRVIELVNKDEEVCDRYSWSRKEHETTTSVASCECNSEEDIYGHGVSTPSYLVETTAYCLAFLSKMKTNTDGDNSALRNGAVKWLACKQSPSGGYSTTQDTVAAFYALSVHAESTESTDLTLKIMKNDEVLREGVVIKQSIEVDSVEITDIPKVSEGRGAFKVCINAQPGGKGKVYAAGEMYFNVPECASTDNFSPLSISYDVIRESGSNVVLEITVKFKDSQREDTGMGLLEIKALSGFCFEESLLDFAHIPEVVRLEIDNEKGMLTIYFEYFASEARLVVEMIKCDEVGGQQPSEMKASLYYDSAVQSRMMYSVSSLQQGNILDPCPNCMVNTARSSEKRQGTFCDFFLLALSTTIFVLFSKFM